jgi:hypothetical protein
MTDHRHVYKLKGKRYYCIVCSASIDVYDARGLCKMGKLSWMGKNDFRTLFEPLPSDNRDERRDAGINKWQEASPWLKRRMSEGLTYNHK